MLSCIDKHVRDLQSQDDQPPSFKFGNQMRWETLYCQPATGLVANGESCTNPTALFTCSYSQFHRPRPPEVCERPVEETCSPRSNFFNARNWPTVLHKVSVANLVACSFQIVVEKIAVLWKVQCSHSDNKSTIRPFRFTRQSRFLGVCSGLSLSTRRCQLPWNQFFTFLLAARKHEVMNFITSIIYIY